MTRTVHGVPMKVETKSLGAGRFRVPSTLIAAPVLGPRGVELALTPRSSVGRLVSRYTQGGLGPVAEHFKVECARSEVARVWLHAATGQKVIATRGFRFRIKKDEVLAVHSGLLDDDVVLDAAMTAVAALARGPVALTKAWRKAATSLEAGALTKNGSGWPRIEGKHEARAVSVSLVPTADGMMTRVQAERGRRADIREPTLRALQAKLELTESSVRLDLDGICDDLARLQEAMALATTSGRPHAGGYR